MSARKPVRKIVVARYRFVGDTLLTIPFLRALRSLHPQAEIHLLVGKDAISLVENCPYIDKAIPFEPRDLGFWGAVSLVRREKYDRAYILKRSLSSALNMWLAGVRERIGFDTDKRGILLTKRIPYRPAGKHEAECFLDHLAPESSQRFDLTLENWTPPEAMEKIRPLISDVPGPKIVLHATSTNPAKCWPKGHFTRLARMLLSQFGGQIYFMGVAGEREGYNTIIEGLDPALRASTHNLCGETSLPESMALLKEMDLVVANDSGMIHMAAAAGAPVIALFGPMDPRQWRPLSDKAISLVNDTLPCRPCRMKITCDFTFPCLTELTPERVFDTCKTFLKS